MKNKYLHFSLIVAAIATLAVGCQKDTDTVTLGAEIQQTVSGNAKVYINDHTPCWHNGDEVYINNAAYPVMAASGSSARIENVVSSSSYRAIFPASIVPEGYNISSSSSVPVALPSVQHYELVNGHQRVDVPMGAYITSGSTLQFYNLCSVVRVTVSNSLNRELPLRSIMLQSENAILSGAGTATVNGESSDYINLSSTARRDVSLGFTNNCPATVPALGTSTFDIVVPAFTMDDVTLKLYTTDDYYCEVTKEEVSLAHNTITTVTLNVTELNEMVAAELVDGPTFNEAIPSNTRIILFEYNSAVNTGTPLSTTNSSVPIFGNLDGNIWRVSTSANCINANPNCSRMFHHDETNETDLLFIDFGNGFNTSNVTDMSVMFSFCSLLTNLDVSSFNTSNVTNMGGMFSECHSLRSLDVSNFNTSNVTGMSAMFSGCSSLRSLDVSDFNTSNVTDMALMFYDCSGLRSLDLSNFNTSHVMHVIIVDEIEGGPIDEYGGSMSYMFSGCSGLTSLDLSSFNTSQVTDMSGMFSGCSGLTSLNLSNFSLYYDYAYNTHTNMELMCYSLSTTSGRCTITCPLDIENAIKEENPYYDPYYDLTNPDPYYPLYSVYYISGLPTSGVTFTWFRP